MEFVSCVWVFCKFLFAFEFIEKDFEFRDTDNNIIGAYVEIDGNIKEMSIVFEII